MRVGKRTGSLILVADGRHVLTDVLTTTGVVLGLAGVMATGWNWLDGGVAILVGCNILITGALLVRQSSAALLDTTDPALLQDIARLSPGIARICGSTSTSSGPAGSGDNVYMDFHLILPRDLSLEASHAEVDKLENLSDHFEGRRIS